MIVDVHVHHVPELFVRFVEKAAPYAARLCVPWGDSVTLDVGPLQICHMMFGGLSDKCFRICYAHLGRYAPMRRARMQREIDTNPQLAARLKRPLGVSFRTIPMVSHLRELST